MSKEDIAVALRNKGYNCAQAVLCAYADEIGLSEKELFCLSEGLGSGLGNTFGTCGALNAACMVISYMNSSGNLDSPNSKGKVYLKMRNMVQLFDDEVGAFQCRTIKGIENGKVLKECEECVRIACRIVEKEK